MTTFSQNQSAPQRVSNCSSVCIALILSQDRLKASLSVLCRVVMGRVSVGMWREREERWGWSPGNTSFMMRSITTVTRLDDLHDGGDIYQYWNVWLQCQKTKLTNWCLPVVLSLKRQIWDRSIKGWSQRNKKKFLEELIILLFFCEENFFTSATIFLLHLFWW